MNNRKLGDVSLTFSGYGVACDYQLQDFVGVRSWRYYWLFVERTFWRILSDIVGAFVDWEKW